MNLANTTLSPFNQDIYLPKADQKGPLEMMSQYGRGRLSGVIEHTPNGANTRLRQVHIGRRLPAL